jgi:hypothetical protein
MNTIGSAEMVGGEAEPRIRKKATLADGSVEHNHVTLTQKYKQCFRNPMDLQYVDEHLYHIQCREIFTLRNEKLHTEI